MEDVFERDLDVFFVKLTPGYPTNQVRHHLASIEETIHTSRRYFELVAKINECLQGDGLIVILNL